MSNVPHRARVVVDQWRRQGCPQQDGILWPRHRWVTRFPEHTDHFTRLPDRLARADVRESCATAAEGGSPTESAFLTVMAWGFGNVGYGPWRTRRIIDSSSEPREHLRAAAEAVGTAGPASGYEALATIHRLRWFGPAFGTKFLYFCPQMDRTRPALILDRLVAGWLSAHSDLKVNPIPWSPRRYERYIECMREWAAELGVTPDVLEERIFVDRARGEGNQWA